jgi:chromatin assembly factor 1 subunit B
VKFKCGGNSETCTICGCSGHTKEVYDLAWSPCGRYFITGAIDNTACVWSLEDSKDIWAFVPCTCLSLKTKARSHHHLTCVGFYIEKCIKILSDHTHYVQGVAWDPLGKYIATQSSDRYEECVKNTMAD